MSRFQPYDPEQASLLPPNARDVLPGNDLALFIREAVRGMDLSELEAAYASEGAPPLAPEMVLGLWVYAFAEGITSARELERRCHRDLGLWYLAAGRPPDHWALSSFRQRHRDAIDGLMVQVIELARSLKLARLGAVAIDSTRVKANASCDKIDDGRRLRRQLKRDQQLVRAWQRHCDRGTPGDEGQTLALKLEEVQQRMREVRERLGKLEELGLEKRSRTDEDARFLRCRQGKVLGYTAEVAVSEDHFIVAQRVTQNTNDNASLLPLVKAVEKNCRERPAKVLADSGFYSNENVERIQEAGIDAYVPDANLAREFKTGRRARTIGRNRVVNAALKQMRRKLRSSQGRATYNRRKGLVEPVFGILKAQRGMNGFRCRGLPKVATEFAFAVLAYNLRRLWKLTWA